MGSEVHIPIMGFHYDEEIYPDPHKFDPERFTPEAVAKRHPLAHMPFGHGPRNCVGINFAILVIKVQMKSLFLIYLSSIFLMLII